MSLQNDNASSSDAKETEDGPLSKYDYVICTIPGIHGIPYGRIVPRYLVPRVLKDGFGLFRGIGYFGINFELPTQIKEYSDNNWPNGQFLPLRETARELKWCSTPARRIGHMLCDLRYASGEQDEVCPRDTLRRQVKRLEQMGLKLKSAFECEYMVFKKDTSEPLGGGLLQYGNTDLLDEDIDFHLDMLDTMRGSGIPVEFFNSESEPGQYEITMTPTEGLEAADAAFVLRYGVRAFCKRRGYRATFMSRPCFPSHSNGMHLNHSLWTEDERDVFHDPEDPQHLSSFARHWVAGLLKHGPALTALVCPTVNCYRRLCDGLAPTAIYWNLEDRLSTIRAKASKSGAYLEFRLPSSACNPYLAIAATVAAGLDGVEKKLPCPEPGIPGRTVSADHAVPLPTSLSAALDALQQDEVLTDALGRKVVERFITLKRDFEVKYFQDKTTTDMSTAEVTALEAKYYMAYI